MELSNSIYDCVIIGGGLIGLATAYQQILRFPGQSLLVLEKEKQLAAHQSGNNSGVIHSGIYYRPGSYKALNCIDGYHKLLEFARRYDVSFELCGKLIVATGEEELAPLRKVYQNGITNGLKGLKILSSKQIKNIEPYCGGLTAIQVPQTGIIDYRQLANTLANLIKDNGNNQIMLEQELLSIEKKSKDLLKLTTQNQVFHSRRLIICAGLQADRLAGLRDEALRSQIRIVPFRGDYYRIKKQAQHKVRHLIYPVPNPDFPFLGVHFTRMIRDDTIECGPNAVFSFKREGYGKTDFSFRDSKEALTFAGTQRFFIKHWQYGLGEYWRAFSKKRFLKSLQKLVPSLTMDDIEPYRSGIRAMALQRNGHLADDFIIRQSDENIIHLINAPSPGATACLAIGKQIVNLWE